VKRALRDFTHIQFHSKKHITCEEEEEEEEEEVRSTAQHNSHHTSIAHQWVLIRRRIRTTLLQ